jgi:hypothetical protein
VDLTSITNEDAPIFENPRGIPKCPEFEIAIGSGNNAQASFAAFCRCPISDGEISFSFFDKDEEWYIIDKCCFIVHVKGQFSFYLLTEISISFFPVSNILACSLKDNSKFILSPSI